MAVAAAGCLAIATPNDIGVTGALPLIRAPHGVARTGTFRLCGRISQENCVIDGDTIRYGGVRIRLADIDAPEIGDRKCASEAALGDRATQRLLQLMNAGPFEIVRVGGRDEDMYGRQLDRQCARRRRSGAALGRRAARLVRLTATTR
jgi:endonuclease YncB( thermonuclease family)